MSGANAQCGTLPPAPGRRPYCPVCAALELVPQDDDRVYVAATDAIFDRCDRISRLHRQYRERR